MNDLLILSLFALGFFCGYVTREIRICSDKSLHLKVLELENERLKLELEELRRLSGRKKTAQ